jgi:hypothetical protein
MELSVSCHRDSANYTAGSNAIRQVVDREEGGAKGSPECGMGPSKMPWHPYPFKHQHEEIAIDFRDAHPS